MPLDADSGTPELDVKSIGTSKKILMGRARARKTGTVRYAGVARSGKKWRRSRRTKMEITASARSANTSDPTEEPIWQDRAPYGEARLLRRWM